MTMPYPRGLEDRLDALERRVEQLFASIQNRQPLTTASQGWQIPNGSLPSAPASGGHLTAAGSEPYWTDSSGSSYSLKPPEPSPPASAPNWPDSFSSPASIVSPPSASDYNLLRSDCAGLHDDLRSVILRGVDFGAWLDPS